MSRHLLHTASVVYVSHTHFVEGQRASTDSVASREVKPERMAACMEKSVRTSM